MILDMHTHIVPEEFPDRDGLSSLARMEPRPDGRSTLFIGDRQVLAYPEACWDMDRRAGYLPALGADKQVLSPVPALLTYEMEPQDGATMSRFLNETIAGMVEQHPDLFYGMGTAPLQEIKLAVAEVRHIKTLGLQGIEIRTNIEGKSLSDPEFRPFFKEAESQDLAVFVHAYAPTFKERMDHMPPALNNPIAFPIEVALAGASLIWGGVLEDCPALRIGLSHGGGSLLQTLARSEETYQQGGSLKELLPYSPMDYAQRMYYDDIAFTRDNLRFLVDSVGASQVMVGTDYLGREPGESKPVETLDALGLSKSEHDAISYENAVRFIGIEHQ